LRLESSPIISRELPPEELDLGLRRIPPQYCFDNLRESGQHRRESSVHRDDNLHEPVIPQSSSVHSAMKSTRNCSGRSTMPNIAIYPWTPAALMTDPRFEASRPNVNLTSVQTQGAPPPVGFSQSKNRCGKLASRTGVRAYLNTNDLKNADSRCGVRHAGRLHARFLIQS